MADGGIGYSGLHWHLGVWTAIWLVALVVREKPCSALSMKSTLLKFMTSTCCKLDKGMQQTIAFSLFSLCWCLSSSYPDNNCTKSCKKKICEPCSESTRHVKGADLSRGVYGKWSRRFQHWFEKRSVRARLPFSSAVIEINTHLVWLSQVRNERSHHQDLGFISNLVCFGLGL